jgi:hypothetical protein
MARWAYQQNSRRKCIQDARHCIYWTQIPGQLQLPHKQRTQSAHQGTQSAQQRIRDAVQQSYAIR